MTALKLIKLYRPIIMARKGRRHKGKRLEPPLPTAKDELILPKYFRMIRGGGYNKAEEERREVLPNQMPGLQDVPRAIRGGRPRLSQPLPLPGPAPEPERVPLLLRAARRFISVFTVEPERPETMPVVPELNYPALYTRYPIMKTVTKTTDIAGEISVDFSHLFVTVPGVVITVKDPDNVFGTVFSTTLTGFEVRLFKMDHDHGGVVDDDGAHTPTINADGNHQHQVQGTGSLSLDTKYGRLVMANYTDYETGHVHTQVQTQLESAHKHHIYSTGGGGGHDHSVPATDGSDDNDPAIQYIISGTACTLGTCMNGWNEASFALGSHGHPNTGLSTGYESDHTHSNIESGAGDAHRHLLNNTGVQPGLGHRHLISSDDLYTHYVYNVTLALDLWTSAEENPYHAHSGVNINAHGHGVASDGRVLLKSTNVTITYIAQEESS